MYIEFGYIYTITVEMPNKNMGFLCEDLMKLFQQLLVAPAALGLMAIPNLVGLLLLSGTVFRLTKNYSFEVD